MACCHYYAYTDHRESAFSVDISAITFGPGCLVEVGERARELGLKRVALFTDPYLSTLPHLEKVKRSLTESAVDFELYDQVTVEPTDVSFKAATKFANEGRFDGFISVGGGSVIDTCKAANLYATWPAELLAYVNAPVGEGRPVPGMLKPHIACPTTCGTGSECTGIAVFDLLERETKTGIASRALRPTLAIIDPQTTATLPGNVVAASGFDVLSHALESYTAIPYTDREKPARARFRPMSQGANPWSDVGCESALRLTGEYLVRAVMDGSDDEARSQMMFAATLAGIAFGNSGVHVPHGMSYSVAGMVGDFRPQGYPGHEPLVPHGMSVIVNSPSAFRFTAPACPDRHLHGASLLGADTRGAGPESAGEVVSERIIELMKSTSMPNGIAGVGYRESDVGGLSEGAFLQQRLLKNAPCKVSLEDLRGIYRGAMHYW